MNTFIIRRLILILKNFTFIPVFIFLCLSGNCQTDDANIRKTERKADSYYEVEEYMAALPLYTHIDSLFPNQGKIVYRLGVCYYHSHHRSKCLSHFIKAHELQYGEEEELDFYIARGYHLNHNFDEAIKHYSSVKDSEAASDSTQREMERYIAMCNTGKQLVEDSLELIIETVGSPVNTRFPEYAPIISADETKLIFTSRRVNTTGGGIDPEDGLYLEDVYISHKDSTGNWGEPHNMGSLINTNRHDAGVGLAPDGRELFIYRSGESRRNLGDIYASKLSGDNWSEPEKLGGHINTDAWEPSATTTTDENTIIFASDRPGGLGGTDLYIVKMQPNGEWTEPQNLGPAINTEYNEDAPFLFSDNKTLFFSSQGHNTMGGYDIFKSVFDEEKNEYTLPENVGYPINTADDDIYFSWNATGERGYFSSWRDDTQGEKDIYVLHKPLENSNRIVMKGVVYDQQSKNRLGSVILLVDSETKDTVGIYSSDQTTGKYLMRLEYGKNYSVIVQSKGYSYTQELITVTSDRTVVSLKKDFYLDKIKVGNVIVFNNIFFDFDKATLRKESRHELELLYTFIKDHPNLKIEIGGHTDNFGSDGYNIRLSRRRAQTIVKYLVDRGIEKKRLIAKGYGEAKPVANNDNPEGRQLNRRTEIKILDPNFSIVNEIGDLKIQYRSQYIKGDDDDNSLDKSLYQSGNKKRADSNTEKNNTTESGKFVYSEENKPLAGTTLKSNVHFLGKETHKLTQFSTKRLMNIVEAMKEYPDMKIEIVAYSDSSESSDTLAQERISSIRAMLIKNGIQENRISGRIEKDKDRNSGSQLHRIDFKVVE